MSEQRARDLIPDGVKLLDLQEYNKKHPDRALDLIKLHKLAKQAQAATKAFKKELESAYDEYENKINGQAT